ncbi:MAG TPA: hypothetical protein DDZ39_04565 [Flavobacteriaceae bacterium]|jgi:hypothetical protein|nr:hypothetical protein [Flavobacteriaceae bacterium]HBS12118.1 hypothetical protein [Flavobacteriaceae bacterium]
MKYLISVFLIFNLFFVNAQKIDTIIETEFIKKTALKADRFLGVDDFGNLYYIKNNTLTKKTNQKTYNYTNTQLGEISSVDIKNPLKIILFYKNFNTVLIVDNNLNELSRPINFNNSSFSKNIHLVNGSSNNNLWIYSLDDNTMQLYNYQNHKIQFTTQVLSFYQADFKVINLLCTYKDCWVIGENNILHFNEYGTFIEKTELIGFSELAFFKNTFIFLKDTHLYLYNDMASVPIHIKDKISIQSFYVNKNDMYIFDGTTIHVYKIVKN